MSEFSRIRRYDKLKLKEFLGSIQRYPFVCKELSLILRTAYAKLLKALQYLIFQDTLTAFRLLPQMQTSGALAAAHFLFQSVDATLPKKRKIMAVAKYKNAIVAHERSRKPPQEEIAVDLPHDVLVHVFGLLDFQSLVSVGPVCWAWNFAANDERLWQRLLNQICNHKLDTANIFERLEDLLNETSYTCSLTKNMETENYWSYTYSTLN